jgi:chromosome segregation ATPase
MNTPTTSRTKSSSVRRMLHVVRRVTAPAALELPEQLAGLRAEIAELRDEAGALAGRVAAVEERAGRAEARAEELAGQVAVLRDGLHEARRLNLRIAELTDLVTEVVLPLHDRDIDPVQLTALRGDTL